MKNKFCLKLEHFLKIEKVLQMILVWLLSESM